ncbi:hypothetical protein RD792_009010 [Penstemon davidsonii]|uniref:Uncharacterized protein n=1 Tax=Penstemon davidsonii TaxID=160366 RepID=A0ABR0DAS1_9LAMI|nr:hypothetical protein RD792_009010 [Penstemon davidsonii]
MSGHAKVRRSDYVGGVAFHPDGAGFVGRVGDPAGGWFRKKSIIPKVFEKPTEKSEVERETVERERWIRKQQSCHKPSNDSKLRSYGKISILVPNSCRSSRYNFNP